MTTFRFVAFIAFCLTVACDTPFSYSVYDARVPAEFQRTTDENLRRLTHLSAETLFPFKVALVADVHYNYDGLATAIKKINADDSILFSIIIGDLTHNGLLTEFMLLHDELQKLKRPYFTVIGNHDHLANGALIYSQMFGPGNYTFLFRKVKFVLFDDVFWETNTIPDFDWLRNEVRPSTQYRLLIPFAHIPPDADQFSDEDKFLFHQIMVEAGVSHSFHGHTHSYSDDTPLGNEVHYVTVPAVGKRSFVELLVSADSVRVRQISF